MQLSVLDPVLITPPMQRHWIFKNTRKPLLTSRMGEGPPYILILTIAISVSSFINDNKSAFSLGVSRRTLEFMCFGSAGRFRLVFSWSWRYDRILESKYVYWCDVFMYRRFVGQVDTLVNAHCSVVKRFFNLCSQV